MSKKRKTLETSSVAGFVPKTDWVRIETANKAIKEEIGFFYEFPQPRRWHSIIEPEISEPDPMLDRPECENCAAICADLVEFFECISCGWNSGKSEFYWKRIANGFWVRTGARTKRAAIALFKEE